MPIYKYAVVNSKNEVIKTVDIFQNINDEVLTFDIESNLPMTRVFAGGSVNGNVLKRSTIVNKLSAAATACGCGKEVKH
ncbi:hypothetical protein [Vibrio crassostreae]|uniref:hypothetical protein n=1 Tax=Vibrio crassostreae TaxID=246167 RepID=UPI001B3154CC|nr:hypothetical protein [Vibrio crassostreae]